VDRSWKRVRTNWRDDYVVKMEDYEAIGVQEYWVVDYLGLGGRRFIGSPKQPTLTVCALVDGEYEMRLFCGGDRIISPLFPDLELAAAQVLLLDS
jgi:Uma2 family endonuclease